MASYDWSNLITMANQGKAPKVKELYDKLMAEPMHVCFFLSTLYEAKKKECETENWRLIKPDTHEIERLKNELILSMMITHIEMVKLYGLRQILTERKGDI